MGGVEYFDLGFFVLLGVITGWLAYQGSEKFCILVFLGLSVVALAGALVLLGMLIVYNDCYYNMWYTWIARGFVWGVANAVSLTVSVILYNRYEDKRMKDRQEIG